ncbi:hypothetical protein [Croceicoccus naphthovorans]|uniref:hypothetical protein n=1 Tax=Croceicoccus naphthovorans TaxID=1348774 RepID=UPI00069F5151|nr:hypothetical protein [Croceicoccus naphthovorans]
MISAPAAAQPEPIAAHEGWGAFREGQKCYAIALAEPSQLARQRQPFASISAGPGNQRLTLRLSRTLARDAVITLDVGNRRFRLTGGGDTAWSGGDRTSSDREVVAAIRSRDTMTVGARDLNGHYFRDSYRLEGAPTAIDAAIVACR